MSEKILNQSICLKQYISEKEYEEIKQLEGICTSKDRTSLKLELDYKLNMHKNPGAGSEKINEFLYYVDGVLVSYLGICCFSRNIGEINGMTHPDWRKKGLFGKLLQLALDECRCRNFSKVLLLSDGKSASGMEFIKTAGGQYEFSEYRMSMHGTTYSESINSSVNLREAVKTDRKEIRRQDAIYFNDAESEEEDSGEEGSSNQAKYMVELNGETIGKINVEYSDDSAYVFGFGILPDFRGKGYGKAALKEILRLINERNVYNIELDVACKNNTALNLYKYCGFEEKAVMNYYREEI